MRPSFPTGPGGLARFIKPVLIENTLGVKVTVREKRESPRRPDYGIVVELLEVSNQKEEIVMACEHLLMVRRKEPGH